MTIAAPAADLPTATAPLAQYSFRKSAFEQEKTFTLYPDRLVVTGEVPTPVVHELANVRKVHLKYDRTNSGVHYRCVIDAPNRRRLSILSKHWGGIGSVEDRGDAYTPFVRALLLAVAQNPGVKLKAGSIPNFVAALVFTPVLALLAAIAFMVDSWWIALGLAALALTCLSMIPRTRPRTVDPANPPANVLP